MSLIIQRCHKHVIDSPEQIFCHLLKQGNTFKISYHTLWTESAKFAAFFKKNAKKNSLIFIMLKHSEELFYAFLGAMRCHCIPCFLPLPTPKQDKIFFWKEQQELLEHYGKSKLLLSMTSLEKIPIKHPNILFLEHAQENISFSEMPLNSSNSTAFLQHSSGTTGLKKGVALSHRAVCHQIDSYSQTIGLVDRDKIISWLPLYHDMGLIACFMLSLLKKIPLIMMDPMEWVYRPSILFEEIEKQKATLCWMPNFAFCHLKQRVPENKTYQLESMRAFINCSETCKKENMDAFLERFSCYGIESKMLQCCYAMAETVFAVTQTELGTPYLSHFVDGKHYLSVGSPLPGVHLHICDDKGKVLEEGQVGEICIQAPFLFSQYFQNPRATEKAFKGGFYQSGDRGFLDANLLYIQGRKKELVIVGGKNIYTHDIESLAHTVDGVKKGRVVCFGMHNEKKGTESVILLAESEEEDQETLIQNIHKCVLQKLNLNLSKVLIVPPLWILKTSSGKVNRQANKNKYMREFLKHPAPGHQLAKR